MNRTESLLDPQIGTAERIVRMCRLFYNLGWASGTGGGISIRDREGIHIAPSGVQKESIRAEDIFLLDADQLDEPIVVDGAQDSQLCLSECTPLFYNAYRLRGAGAVLHSHSIWAVLAGKLVSPDGKAATWRCRNLEMQKGLRGMGCFDELIIPVIPNTARESELRESMADAMTEYPDVDAVMVAGHGVYVWGSDWQEAKVQAECLDYLMRASVEFHRLGLSVL